MRSSAARVGSLPYVAPDRLKVNVREGDVNIIKEIADPWRALCRGARGRRALLHAGMDRSARLCVFSWGQRCPLLCNLGCSVQLCSSPDKEMAHLSSRAGSYSVVPDYATRADLTRCAASAPQVMPQSGARGDPPPSRSDWDLISIRETPGGRHLSRPYLTRPSLTVWICQIANCHALESTHSYSEGCRSTALADVSRLRGKLRHVRRELEQCGTLRLRRASLPRREELDKFYELEASGWKKEKSEVQSWRGVNPTVLRFFTAERRTAQLLIDVFSRISTHQLLAAHLGPSYRRTYYFFKLAYNEAFKEFAPGHLIIWQI